MTPHERELITKVADEVRTTDRSVIDPDAERLIKTEVAAQKNAAYILTQRVIVQELALRQAQAKIDELQARLSGVGGSAGRGGFLPGAAGAAGGIPAAAGQPWQQGPHVGDPPPAAAGGGAVGSFLKTAAAAAAGTVAANLIYDGVRGYAASSGGIGGMIPGFGGGHGGPVPGPSPEYVPQPGGRYTPPPTDYDSGGDFGGPAVDDGILGSGGDYGTDDDQGGGGDFGTDDQDDDAGGGGDLGGDFGAEDTGGGGGW